MRLVELQDLDSLRTALRLRRLSAQDKEREATVSPNELSQIAKDVGVVVPPKQDALIAFKNLEDPQGKEIRDITNKNSLKLATQTSTGEPLSTDQPNKTVDQMARKAAKYKPYGS